MGIVGYLIQEREIERRDGVTGGVTLRDALQDSVAEGIDSVVQGSEKLIEGQISTDVTGVIGDDHGVARAEDADAREFRMGQRERFLLAEIEIDSERRSAEGSPDLRGDGAEGNGGIGGHHEPAVLLREIEDSA